ncbi:hypothetical protein PR048_027723 [Dryococelus australis]|uniref:Uncharacterized protein n=1 Tax=Dryococelus australis TaxID=614101 RepID=A0ABQ9GHC1_9NEOP|nr:hypothetical protein PR048_027723 [Dryococelus australis]
MFPSRSHPFNRLALVLRAFPNNDIAAVPPPFLATTALRQKNVSSATDKPRLQTRLLARACRASTARSSVRFYRGSNYLTNIWTSTGMGRNRPWPLLGTHPSIHLKNTNPVSYHCATSSVGECGAASECRGWGKREISEKTMDQRHSPARFPRAKIWKRPQIFTEEVSIDQTVTKRRIRHEMLPGVSAGEPINDSTNNHFTVVVRQYKQPFHRTEQRQNARAEEADDTREYPPTNGILRHDSHMRRSGVTQPGIEPRSPWWEASWLTAQQPGRGGVVVRRLGSHRGELGSIPGGSALGFSRVVIVPDDAASRRAFSGISPSPSAALKTSMLRAAQISPPQAESICSNGAVGRALINRDVIAGVCAKRRPTGLRFREPERESERTKWSLGKGLSWRGWFFGIYTGVSGWFGEIIAGKSGSSTWVCRSSMAGAGPGDEIIIKYGELLHEVVQYSEREDRLHNLASVPIPPPPPRAVFDFVELSAGLEHLGLSPPMATQGNSSYPCYSTSKLSSATPSPYESQSPPGWQGVSGMMAWANSLHLGPTTWRGVGPLATQAIMKSIFHVRARAAFQSDCIAGEMAWTDASRWPTKAGVRATGLKWV